jgi:hypothetical protein
LRIVALDMRVPEGGFWAVEAATDVRLAGLVAVSAGEHGVFVFHRYGRDGTVTAAPELQGDDVRVLRWQQVGWRTFLWAGITVAGAKPGSGCRVWDIHGEKVWRQLDRGWAGAGSCRDIAFDDTRVYAATSGGGVYWSAVADGPSPVDDTVPWNRPEPTSGLVVQGGKEARGESRPPPSTGGQFEPVTSIAVHGGWLFAVSPSGPARRGGVLRARDATAKYEDCRSYQEGVVLPPTWLVCSGKHEIEVEEERESPTPRGENVRGAKPDPAT